VQPPTNVWLLRLTKQIGQTLVKHSWIKVEITNIVRQHATTMTDVHAASQCISLNVYEAIQADYTGMPTQQTITVELKDTNSDS